MREKVRRRSTKKDRPERTGINSIKDKLKDLNMSDLLNLALNFDPLLLLLHVP